ncbi:MAG: hypothetical protein AUK44_03670 [Porphyromonadaceae bacterium CG2_30_38_12]|nr:MAG: hypothetical protein AUK44_03670 [Porphyromonadaceae bacterium CG2_30_38_12]
MDYSYKTFLAFLKGFILIASYGYLGYVLYNYPHYAGMFSHLERAISAHLFWLLLVVLLLPINLLIETWKWKSIVSKSTSLGFRQAFSGVLAGFSSGFFTPNRVGELVGRVLFMPSAHRKIGVFYALLNSLTQNITLIVCGLPAFLAFVYVAHSPLEIPAFTSIIIFLLLFITMLVVYFELPRLIQYRYFSHKFPSLKPISLYNSKHLLQILLYSLFRFTVFSVQFYAALQFFSVSLEPWQALIAIPVSYLFVTFTPAFAFSEIAIRGSYAVYFIGFFSVHTAEIILASFFLWVINFALPMLGGSILFVKSNGFENK